MAHPQESRSIANTVARSVIIVVMLFGLFGLLHYVFTGPAISVAQP
ncbi:MAG: hypothetical protein IPM46_05225 [Flavobacteriales bacterium]|nr:hypothetical protein [Flavobacteriales bacterium]